jgi:hypothetical protein
VWVYSTFTQDGLTHLERSYQQLKDFAEFPRSSRISAEDHASSVAALLKSEGRGDLVRS